MSIRSKVCSTCKKDKPFKEFSSNVANPDKLSKTCRLCLSEYQRAYKLKKGIVKNPRKPVSHIFTRDVLMTNTGKSTPTNIFAKFSQRKTTGWTYQDVVVLEKHLNSLGDLGEFTKESFAKSGIKHGYSSAKAIIKEFAQYKTIEEGFKLGRPKRKGAEIAAEPRGK